MEEPEATEKVILGRLTTSPKDDFQALRSVTCIRQTLEYDYPKFHLSMACFWCEVIGGDLILLEAQDARWLTRNELDSVEWLPADMWLAA